MEKNYNMAEYDKEIQICPKYDIILVWSRKPKKAEKEAGNFGDIIMYHNCRTGKQSSNDLEVIDKDRPYKIKSRKSTDYYGTYYKATSDNKMLCCIVAKFNSRAIKPGETREWEEVVRYYFTQKKETIVPASSWGNLTEDKKHRILEGITSKDLGYIYTNYSLINSQHENNWNYEDNRAFREEACKVFSPVVTIAGNRMLEIYNPSRFDWFMSYKEPIVKTGPKQQKINELTAIELPIVDIPDLEEFKEKYQWYANADTRFFAVITKIRDGLACVRTMAVVKDDNDQDSKGILYESGRIYVEGQKVIVCKPNNFKQYVSTNLSLSDSYWNYPIIDFNPDDVKGTALEYFGSVVDELPEKIRCLAIKTFLKNPVIEQLYKGGLKEVVIYGLETSYNNAMEKIESLIRLNTGEKNFYSIVGVNKFQLKTLQERWNAYNKDDCSSSIYHSYGYEEIRLIKDILNASNISSIDNETFCEILRFISFNWSGYSYDLHESMRLLIEIYGLKSALSMIDTLISFNGTKITTTSRWGRREQSFASVYKDYLSMVLKINGIRQFRPQFKTAEELLAMHDAAVLVYNTQKDVYKNDAFIKSVKRYEKYAYSDDKYSIIIPSLPADMAKEGLELHHCVKSYIDRVIEGRTNILFLRKNEELDKPFFTIELSNSGEIEQVHGMCNRNASTEPDMLYFIDDWANKFKLKKNNYNKVR